MTNLPRPPLDSSINKPIVTTGIPLVIVEGTFRVSTARGVLLLEGDQQVGDSDALLLEGDQQSGTDHLALEGTY